MPNGASAPGKVLPEPPPVPKSGPPGPTATTVAAAATTTVAAIGSNAAARRRFGHRRMTPPCDIVVSIAEQTIYVRAFRRQSLRGLIRRVAGPSPTGI